MMDAEVVVERDDLNARSSMTECLQVSIHVLFGEVDGGAPRQCSAPIDGKTSQGLRCRNM